MKRLFIACCALVSLTAAARPDMVRLINGKGSQGAVVSWGTEEIRFVLQGGTLADAVTVPVSMVEVVVLSDGTEHRPGTDSWITTGRRETLPWEQRPPATPSGPPRRPGYQFRLNLRAARQSGYTTYQIYFPWGPYTGNSRLDFPMDGYSATIAAAVLSRPSAARQFQYGLEAEFSRRMSDPRHDMTDSDWVSLLDERLVYSATTSSATSGAWDISVAGKALVPMGAQVKIGGLLGFRYNRMAYDIYGVAGWQDTTFNGDVVYFDELQDTRVLQYRVSYGLPMIGILLLAESADQLSLQARAAYLVWATASDEDLHLLRNKKSFISADGSGYLLQAEARVRLATLANESTVSLGGSYEYLKVDAEGTQTQAYYGDDPGFEGDETGLVMTGIDAKLFQRRHAFGVAVTYEF